MSDLRDDDDTSPGRITQGGRPPRAGGSIWWVLALLALAVALGLWWIPPQRLAPAERGTAPVSAVSAAPSAGQATAPATAAAAAPAAASAQKP